MGGSIFKGVGRKRGRGTMQVLIAFCCALLFMAARRVLTSPSWKACKHRRSIPFKQNFQLPFGEAILVIAFLWKLLLKQISFELGLISKT